LEKQIVSNRERFAAGTVSDLHRSFKKPWIIRASQVLEDMEKLLDNGPHVRPMSFPCQAGSFW